MEYYEHLLQSPQECAMHAAAEAEHDIIAEREILYKEWEEGKAERIEMWKNTTFPDAFLELVEEAASDLLIRGDDDGNVPESILLDCIDCGALTVDAIVERFRKSVENCIVEMRENDKAEYLKRGQILAKGQI